MYLQQHCTVKSDAFAMWDKEEIVKPDRFSILNPSFHTHISMKGKKKIPQLAERRKTERKII
jgi:hypothetical protein